jgi:hypothetical protein
MASVRREITSGNAELFLGLCRRWQSQTVHCSPGVVTHGTKSAPAITRYCAGLFRFGCSMTLADATRKIWANTVRREPLVVVVMSTSLVCA